MSKDKNKEAAGLPLNEDAGKGLETKPNTPGVPPTDPLGIPNEYRDPRLDAASRMPKNDGPEDPNKPRPFAPLPVITRSVQAYYGDEVKTVTMIFPKPVTVVNDEKIKIHFPAGTQEVPEVLKDNWYLAANGVTFYDRELNKRTDGPTVQEWVESDYDPADYPPSGYQSKSTEQEIETAIAVYKHKKGQEQG